MIFTFHPDFFDQYNLLKAYRINDNGNRDTDDAHNGVLHSSYLATLQKLVGDPTRCSTIYHINIFYNITRVKTDWSHDDTTGLVCADILPWHNLDRYWFRFERFLYLYKQGKKLAILGLPLLCLKMIYSCLRNYKAKNGLIETDGKLIAWNILENHDYYMFKPVRKICYWLCERHFGKNWLSFLFDVKFGRNDDHPCRILSKYYEAKKEQKEM